jgi:hypothetical protein
MGRKSAGAHFQQQLAEVLSRLFYKECELYMDDILPFADSKEEMLQHLHRLFREYNVTLKQVGKMQQKTTAKKTNTEATRSDAISKHVC